MHRRPWTLRHARLGPAFEVSLLSGRGLFDKLALKHFLALGINLCDILIEPLLVDDVYVAYYLLLALDLLSLDQLLGRKETRRLNVLVLPSLLAVEECPNKLRLRLLD